MSDRYAASDAVLIKPTGDRQVDAVLVVLVARINEALGERVRGCYLVGSYAVGCPIVTSDIDVAVLFKDSASEAEREQVRALVAPIRAASPRPLDVSVVNEADLLRDGATRFKYATRLLHGEDVRDTLPVRPLDVYARNEIAGALGWLLRMRGNPPVLPDPLTAPNPTDTFLGYASRLMKLPDGSERPCTKNLLNATTLVASALLAAEAGQYVHHKSQLAGLYHAHIGDAWTELVEQVYERCRSEWHYLVPDGAAERALLRELCERQLAFEWAFVPRCRAFLQQELAHADEVVRAGAARQLTRLA